MNAWHELDRRCTALNRDGERCGRAPIRGGTVCVLHGGATANAQAAAKMRLLAMVEPVLGVFESILETYNSTRCAACGKPTGDPVPVIRVGQLVLDRAGFHPSLTIQQAPPAPDRYADYSDDQLVEKLEQMLAAAIERRDLHRRAQLPAAADGVLIDDGFEVPEDGAEPPAAWSIPPGEPTKEPANE